MVILVLHVDEVDDDQTAQVSEAHLPTNLHRRLDVRLQNEILAILAVTLVTPRIDVNRDEGFGLLHDDFSSGRQKHASHEGLLDLPLHVKPLENRNLLVEMTYLGLGFGGYPLNRFDQAVVIVLIVNLHAIDVISKKIPGSQSDQIRLFVKKGRAVL